MFGSDADDAPLEVPEDYSMSEPARQAPSPETGLRPSPSSAPLRDWLAAMRATVSETRSAEGRDAGPAIAETDVESRISGWSPRLVSAAAKSAEAADEDVASTLR